MPLVRVLSKTFKQRVVILVQRRIFLPASSLHDRQYEERDVAGGLFKSKSGRIKLSVVLPHSGYLLGETVTLSGCIENTSTSSVCLHVSLVQQVIYNYPESYDESCVTKVKEYTLLTGTSKKFAASPSQGISWSYNKLRIPMHLPPSAATEGCNYFSISYYVKVSMESSGTAKNATVTFDITIGNAYLCALQPERAQPTLNEEFGWIPERGKSAADVHSNFSLSSGATGVNSLPAADLPHHTFEPTPMTLSATDTSTTVQPPSYYELFLDKDSIEVPPYYSSTIWVLQILTCSAQNKELAKCFGYMY